MEYFESNVPSETFHNHIRKRNAYGLRNLLRYTTYVELKFHRRDFELLDSPPGDGARLEEERGGGRFFLKHNTSRAKSDGVAAG